MVKLHSLFPSLEFQERFHYAGELGAIYHKHQTTFKLWAPTATEVVLITYPSGHNGIGHAHPLTLDKNGVWVKTLPGDLHGVYYTYRVTVEGKTQEAVDPYAKAVGVNGKRGMVVDLERTNPKGWGRFQRPALQQHQDAIIYEAHIRDISIDPASGIHFKGKYLGLTEQNTKGPGGVKTGLDHLKELGITHLHLLPVYDFYTVDEADPSTKEYNWGYDPHNYNALEGSYSIDPFNGEVRIKEFKEMVKTLGENGIGVILDVVYNHTYLTDNSNLNKIVPGYYYRQDAYGKFTNGSGCGNELATERSMVRKMIIDSIMYWAQEYKIAGFRFDLMGLYDIETMNQIREALNTIDPSIIMYGEGWTGGHSPLADHKKALKGSMHQMPGIAAFNDDTRDGIKGNVFDQGNCGFINGANWAKESVKFGIVGGIQHYQVNNHGVCYSHHPWASEPSQTVNYAEAHDNLTLWDKLAASVNWANEQERIKMQKMAGAIILTSQGIPFLHAGMEFLRTKYGEYNSYNLPDEINMIDWERKMQYYDVFEYYQGLIQLRKSFSAFRLPNAEEVRKRLRFFDGYDEHLIAFTLTNEEPKLESLHPWNKIVVVHNARNFDSDCFTISDWSLSGKQDKPAS